MESNAFYVVGGLAAALAYLLMTAITWRALGAEQSRGAEPWRRGLVPLIALAHAALLADAILGSGSFRFGFAHALSGTLLLAVALLWVEGFFVRMLALDLLVLPAAAVSVLLPMFFQGAQVSIVGARTAFRLHLLIAIGAYSLFTIAALQALLMTAVDRRLHAAYASEHQHSGRWLAHMPPLLAMERLLFRLITSGFVLLTLTVLTGVFFSEELFGRALRADHKSIFAIASWFVFAGLLTGRFVFGWRGRKALRWTIAGFLMLMLAYVGSRFVLEVILKRF
jgi:ABC-type uncharacterized transport system permease subunit